MNRSRRDNYDDDGYRMPRESQRYQDDVDEVPYETSFRKTSNEEPTPNVTNVSNAIESEAKEASSLVSNFFHSESILTNVSFAFLILFVFIILFQIGLTLISQFVTSRNSSPQLINGMVDGSQLIVITQDPAQSGSVTISRSNNAVNGVEFTWSVWVFITKIDATKYQHIFHKGDININSDTGLNFPNNAPGLYISPNNNELVIIMNTYTVINEEIKIDDIPMNKWVNIIIRCRNKTMDVYINGTIAKSIELIGVPKQNYGNVYVGMNGGFSGNLSNLWYYNYAININQIDGIVSKGPNTSSASLSSTSNKVSNYLSMRWFFG